MTGRAGGFGPGTARSDPDGPTVLDARDPGRFPEVAERVAAHLRAGGLLAYPTETVYGFGCAIAPAPVRRLARLKGRDPEKPFLVLVPGRESAADLEWTAAARRLAAELWPGPVTLVLRDPGERYPPGVRSPDGTVAVRASPHPLVRAIVDHLRTGITSTSANLPGEAPARDASGTVRAARGLGAGQELWVVDGGRLGTSPPSTLVDCTTDPPVLRRRGAVPEEEVRRLLPELRAESTDDDHGIDTRNEEP